MNDTSKEPSAGQDFDKAYKAPITFWGDVRIPKELKDLVETYKPKTSLELGCGLGRFSSFVAEQEIKATGVDFSLVAIEKLATDFSLSNFLSFGLSPKWPISLTLFLNTFMILVLKINKTSQFTI